MAATLQEIVPTRQPPAPGQLVSVRNRRFVVTAIAGSSTHEERSAAQNLVTLSSVEDDALGEELQVVWEIEPGAAILERASMPELSGFDSPARLDALLMRIFPQGLEEQDSEARKNLRIAHHEWEANGRDPAIYTAWLEFVLGTALEYPENTLLSARFEAVKRTAGRQF